MTTTTRHSTTESLLLLILLVALAIAGLIYAPRMADVLRQSLRQTASKPVKVTL